MKLQICSCSLVQPKSCNFSFLGGGGVNHKILAHTQSRVLRNSLSRRLVITKYQGGHCIRNWRVVNIVRLAGAARVRISAHPASQFRHKNSDIL